MSLGAANMGSDRERIPDAAVTGVAAAESRVGSEIRLSLTVRDPEVVAELGRRPEGEERERYALAALRLGVLALRQASGMVDAETVRREGERLVAGIREQLSSHAQRVTLEVAETLKRYFDPSDGELHQRLDRLLRKDGDLESLLARHLGGDDSTVAKTLAKHVGEGSPLLRMLSPEQSNGLLASLSKTIEAALAAQRQHILDQFSLDRGDSALSRMIRQLTDSNGRLREEFAKDLEKVRREFSLDNSDGALRRLVDEVTRAQKTIAAEFSRDNRDSALNRMSSLMEETGRKVDARLTLDTPDSPLARLRRELCDLIKGIEDANAKFHADVRATMESLKARREEAARSTRHGLAFEDAVGGLIGEEAGRMGDILEPVGATQSRKGKVGDYIVSLGEESGAPGARIVIEVKERKGYSVDNAFEEMREARENREAAFGMFVFSKTSAPENIPPILRRGRDVLVVWDSEDRGTDVYLRAAFWIARALAVRERRESERIGMDISHVEGLTEKMQKDAAEIEAIIKLADTVAAKGQDIRIRADTLRRDIAEGIGTLRRLTADLRDASGSGASGR
ncbi:MAG: hypothetical protein N3A38_01160 [Planctomycetota bacterium]|nr:hypothetical protein [Planctomycetota bacterium]